MTNTISNSEIQSLVTQGLADIAVQDAGLFKELAAKAQAGAKQKPAAVKA
ncbi:MAG: hypothetical protein K2X09_06940 [Rickettsiales bacterium]|nr:hypothetical protein [Rickettsiales bacterium]